MAFLWNMLWAELNSLQIQMCVCAKSLQSCPTLCDPMDCSLPVSSVHGILQAIIQVGSHSLLQGIFPTKGLNTVSCFAADSLPSDYQGSLCNTGPTAIIIFVVVIAIVIVTRMNDDNDGDDGNDS